MAQKSRARSTRTDSRSAIRAAALQPEWWDRLSDRTQHLICLGLLVVLSFGFFAPLHFSGKSLYGGDTISWRAMAESLIQYEKATGDTPLWTPNAFAGMPGYMIYYPNAVPQLDSISNVLRGVIWPSSHFLVLLAGMYLLLVFLTGNKLSGLVAAAGYGLTAYMTEILAAGHNTKFIALCFAPWLVLAFVYALKRPGLLSGFLFAAATALNLRAAHPQITYYVVFLIGIWWLTELVRAARSKELAPFVRATAFLALGGVLGLAMVAQPYLVNAEYKHYTIRGSAPGGAATGMDWDYAMGWSQGWGELLTLLIPNAYGGGGATYWGPKIFTAGPHYAGIVVVVLAVLAVIRWRRPAVVALAVSAVLMILFSLGENFASLNRLMYDYFPLFSAFRVPETWLSIVVFALAVLAGIGLVAVTRREEEAGAMQRTTRAVMYAFGGVAVLIVALILLKGSLLSFSPPNEFQTLAAQVQQQRPDLSLQDPQVTALLQQEIGRRQAERISMFTSDAWRSLLFLVLAGAALLAARFRKIPSWAAQFAIALLVVLDVGGVSRRYLNEDMLVASSRLEDNIPQYDFDRFILQQQQRLGGPGRFRVLSLEGNPSTTARPSFFYESMGGYHGAKLRLYQDYLDHMLLDSTTGSFSTRALDLMNVRYIVARGAVPGMNAVYRDTTGMIVNENPMAMPRAWIVGESEVARTPQEAWARLRDPAFDLHAKAVLDAPSPLPAAPVDSASRPVVTPLRYGAQDIAWRVQTDRPRLLVASEVYYPAGWAATVDGKPAQILRANYLLRAVPVPAGTHTVEMRFAPRMHTLGVTISAVSTALVYGAILLLLALGWRRRRTTLTPEVAA